MGKRREVLWEERCLFCRGHGFINKWDEERATRDRVPTYSFSGRNVM